MKTSISKPEAVVVSRAAAAFVRFSHSRHSHFWKRRLDPSFLLIARNQRDTRQGMTALFERPDCIVRARVSVDKAGSFAGGPVG
jgi:hypothetical protein